MTNRDWTIDAASIAEALGVERVRLVNDFEAQGALPAISHGKRPLAHWRRLCTRCARSQGRARPRHRVRRRRPAARTRRRLAGRLRRSRTHDARGGGTKPKRCCWRNFARISAMFRSNGLCPARGWRCFTAPFPETGAPRPRPKRLPRAPPGRRAARHGGHRPFQPLSGDGGLRSRARLRRERRRVPLRRDTAPPRARVSTVQPIWPASRTRAGSGTFSAPYRAHW